MWFNNRLASFKFAFQGLVTLCRTQPNFLIHLFIGIIAVAAAAYFGFNKIEWLLLVLTITMVLVAEAFNSALEFLTDLASPDYHPLAKKAKDVAAASVLITAIGAIVMGILLFSSKLLIYIK